MDELRKERTRELVDLLERAGMNCGLLISQGAVFLRHPGTPYTDTPMMFDAVDLYNAVTLGLIEKQRVMGSYEWEWYVAKRRPSTSPTSLSDPVQRH